MYWAPEIHERQGRYLMFATFIAPDAPWARSLGQSSTRDDKLPSYVSDGPFLFRLTSGHLLML